MLSDLWVTIIQIVGFFLLIVARDDFFLLMVVLLHAMIFVVVFVFNSNVSPEFSVQKNVLAVTWLPAKPETLKTQNSVDSASKNSHLEDINPVKQPNKLHKLLAAAEIAKTPANTFVEPAAQEATFSENFKHETADIANQQSTSRQETAEITPPRFDVAYLENPAPSYPLISRRVGEEGKVILRVWVEASGLPKKVEIQSSSGFERLDQSARNTVSRYKFIPAKRGEVAISAWVLVPILFNLKS